MKPDIPGAIKGSSLTDKTILNVERIVDGLPNAAPNKRPQGANAMEIYSSAKELPGARHQLNIPITFSEKHVLWVMGCAKVAVANDHSTTTLSIIKHSSMYYLASIVHTTL